MLATLLLGTCALQGAGSWPPAPPLRVAAEEDPGALPESVSARAAGADRWEVSFEFEPDRRASEVHLVGSFNEWRTNATPMRRRGSRWEVSLPLAGGEHLYKFLVDGSEWIQDPRNGDGAPDGHGGRNSVLRLGLLALLDRSPARAGDGVVDGAALRHDPASPFFLQRLSADRMVVRLRALSHDLEAVEFAARGAEAVAMTPVLVDPLWTTWEAQVPAPAAGVPYTFVLRDGGPGVSGPASYTMSPQSDGAFQTPEWSKHAIWYQIMLDRFRNGDPDNDPDPVRPWRSEWFRTSDWETRDGQTFWKWSVYRRMYGGDLAGMRSGLDHLQELGVNAIYLNPVFQAASHHKYDATSFVHVDDRFGTLGDYGEAEKEEDLLDPSSWTWTESDRLFLDVIAECKSRGMRVVIDGVWNHVGTAHPAFRDVRKKGRKSRYADWFDVTNWKPFEYQGWAGFGELPAFRKNEEGLASEAVKEHIFAVTRRWMDPDGDGDPSDGVDGWRLDVPNEINGPFWEEWRALVKSINPDAYLSGEIWNRAEEWLDGKRFDAVMNYEFAKTAVAWIGHDRSRIAPSEVDRRLAELRMAYPAEATYALMNLVDSHDTDRLVSMMFNPDREYDRMNRPQDDNERYSNDKPDETAYRKARLVALLQMTYVGAPMIYYGDEVGMWGADDPTNRKPMLWKDHEPYDVPEENHVMDEHLEHYRRVVALRNAHPALRTGSFESVLVDDEQDVWVFLREDADERVLVALNASALAGATVELPAALSAEEGVPDWSLAYGAEDASFARNGAQLTLTLPALDGLVLAAPR